ncbi:MULTISPECIES: methionine ABC transporter ATP-binding protein [Thermomonospora]|uniref:D-methionine transport system ATP-binding protein n=1 Tax=Thermomonospora cellulosilytica TaxID=1411118 RepID=A0A7W3MYT0_9ACTN|nr:MULTISPECIES: ATP-binding cassette domain-containing protein [Thermomonospora]MBA9004404.1 D-methionine transport system ATP-binding protein [Thermomonospora cellulosilytica]
MIQIEKLKKTYRTRGRTVTAVDGVDLHVREGEIFGVLGRSGAGKSTLLRCVNLLERPDSGRVVVDGRDLAALPERELRTARQRIGMIHQHFGLLTSRTVAGNVAFPLEVMGVPRRERARRVAELLDLVGLAEHAKAYPAQISGGQKQRVGIARALAGRPRVLLSDEATSALDPETTAAILRLLRDLNRELGLTILLITHEMEVVKRICDSAAIMRAGRLTESGPLPDLLTRPGSQLARDLFPLPQVPARPGTTVVDVTFVGEAADRPFVSSLARTYSIDVNILGGAVEQVGDRRVGRLRIELPGDPDANAAQLAHLRDAGLTVEVLDAAAERPEVVA